MKWGRGVERRREIGLFRASMAQKSSKGINYTNLRYSNDNEKEYEKKDYGGVLRD